MKLGVSQNSGYLFGGPHNKDYSILGSILGSPYFGKLPVIGMQQRKRPLQLSAELLQIFINPSRNIM